MLVVDDNKDITDLVQAMLDSPSYTCVAANGGEECLDILKKRSFDLVLLDLAMPGMSGLTYFQFWVKVPKRVHIIL